MGFVVFLDYGEDYRLGKNEMGVIEGFWIGEWYVVVYLLKVSLND